MADGVCLAVCDRSLLTFRRNVLCKEEARTTQIETWKGIQKEGEEARRRRITSAEGFGLVLLISRYIFVFFLKITECGFFENRVLRKVAKSNREGGAQVLECCIVRSSLIM
jgi:hypothetical protein